jgi:hypothetical protein
MMDSKRPILVATPIKPLLTKHQCELCHNISLDFTMREPWTVLEPLHEAISTWPQPLLATIDPSLVPSSKTFTSSKIHKHLPSRLKRSHISKSLLGLRINQEYQNELKNDNYNLGRMRRELNGITTLRLTGEECLQKASDGCKLCLLLVNGIINNHHDKNIGNHAFLVSYGGFKAPPKYGTTIDFGSILLDRLSLKQSTITPNYVRLLSFHPFSLETGELVDFPLILVRPSFLFLLNLGIFLNISLTAQLGTMIKILFPCLFALKRNVLHQKKSRIC